MKKISFTLITSMLLTGCASHTPAPEITSKSKSESDKSFTELMLGVKADPNEKNPILYELPGMWQLSATKDDCKKRWQEIRISYDKTTLSLTQVMLKNGTTTPVERNYFSILDVGKNYLKLQTKQDQKNIEEYWTLARPTIFTFALKNNKTNEITPTWTRCTAMGISFEGKITEEDFEALELKTEP